MNIAIIFDMDGTLFKTEDVAVPAFKHILIQLKKDGDFKGELPSDDEIISWFGMTLEEIWEQLIPGADEEVKSKANKIVLREELRILKEGHGHLYADVKQTLQTLKERGALLFVASNGLDGYIKGICDHFQITDLFEGLYSADLFDTDSKVELVAKLLDDFSIEKAIMVGDRTSDMDAGQENDLFTIGCAYGFAGDYELNRADKVIYKFNDLLPLIDEYIR